MVLEIDRPRVLLACGAGYAASLRDAFKRDPLQRWEVLQADSFSGARFVLQHDPCDLLLVNHDLYESEGAPGLAWLAWQRVTPVVFLAGPSAEHFQQAYEMGVSQCVPRQLAVEHPPLLATIMQQALGGAELRQKYRRTKDNLTRCRRHIDRLVSLIWRTTPHQNEVQWFSQRSMLDRLEEELSRAERHQVPLTLALGELQPVHADAEPAVLPDWAMAMIARGKRRCDVAGQYGPHGFCLLMVHTPIKGGLNCVRRMQKMLENPESQRTVSTEGATFGPTGASNLRKDMAQVAGSFAGPHGVIHACFGVSSTATGKSTPAALLRAAEQNLEAARADSHEHIIAD